MGTYGYISIIAMFCYCFMLLTFLAAKKDKLVNSFFIMLLAQILWTGGSVFMRMKLWPNYEFWYQVSLLGILLLPYAYDRFINAFSGKNDTKGGILYLCAMTFCFIVNIPTGLLLKPPVLVERDGGQFFEYEVTIWVGVFFLIAALLLMQIFATVWTSCKKSGSMRKQYEPILLGIVLMFFGNLAISFPVFKGFPIDILCGLLNAFLLLYALIRRRLFRLQLLASESVCYGIGLFFSLILFINLSPYLQRLAYTVIPEAAEYYTLIFAVLFLAAYLGFTFIWKLVINNVFVKDELLQAEKLKRYSSAVSKTLCLKDIMDLTIRMLQESLFIDSIYVYIQQYPGGPYRGSYSNRPLSDLSFGLEEDNPVITWLKDNDDLLLYREFKSTVEYKSMWENEKYELEKMGIQCCAGLKDGGQLTGVILFADKNPRYHIGYNEMQMISSITSVASIAVKNARLYEQAYQEARTDEMTGLLNRKSFYEVLNREFEKSKESSLALIIFNVDDFKLYNQLYGEAEGDKCLQKIADIIRSSVGEQGYSARYSGKEFAILLPKYDIFSAKNLASSISHQIYHMNDLSEDYKLKCVTVSTGISAAPYGAKSVKELLDNADLAVYHVKHSGKNGIQIFDMSFQNENCQIADARRTAVYQEYESTIYALTAAIDAKDHYTFSHSNNVAYYATELARYLGMNEDMVEIIRQSALLHDVGKIGIPEDILNKAGRLTEEEYGIIKGHVEASIGIIRHLPSLDYVIPAVIGHHERYDGRGYPRRIAGEDIPATARILCIADSFDAMTSKRCYKSAFSLEKARRILLEEAGRQFDPEMVQVFVRCLDLGQIKIVNGEYSGEDQGKK